MNTKLQNKHIFFKCNTYKLFIIYNYNVWFRAIIMADYILFEIYRDHSHARL